MSPRRRVMPRGGPRQPEKGLAPLLILSLLVASVILAGPVLEAQDSPNHIIRHPAFLGGTLSPEDLVSLFPHIVVDREQFLCLIEKVKAEVIAIAFDQDLLGSTPSSRLMIQAVADAYIVLDRMWLYLKTGDQGFYNFYRERLFASLNEILAINPPDKPIYVLCSGLRIRTTVIEGLLMIGNAEPLNGGMDRWLIPLPEGHQILSTQRGKVKTIIAVSPGNRSVASPGGDLSELENVEEIGPLKEKKSSEISEKGGGSEAGKSPSISAPPGLRESGGIDLGSLLEGILGKLRKTSRYSYGYQQPAIIGGQAGGVAVESIDIEGYNTELAYSLIRGGSSLLSLLKGNNVTYLPGPIPGPEDQGQGGLHDAGLVVAPLIAGGILLGVIVRDRVYGAYRLYSLRRLVEEDRVRASLLCYREALRILAEKGIPKRVEEAPREYLERVSNTLDSRAYNALRGITELYEKAKYGGFTPTVEEASRCLSSLRELEG